jgi:hypothetical protein
VEQRIDSSSKPLDGAGLDPTFIPGLTSPASAEPEDAKPEGAKPEEAEVDAEGEDSAEVTEPVAEEAEEAEESTEESEDADAAVDGPVFEASDRRAKIVADHKGVRLSLDDQACEFRWDEIGAIETEVPRFGKRLTITVHTPDRRWYPIEIEAPARSRFKEWDEQLDAVLDAYFEEDDD